MLQSRAAHSVWELSSRHLPDARSPSPKPSRQTARSVLDSQSMLAEGSANLFSSLNIALPSNTNSHGFQQRS